MEAIMNGDLAGIAMGIMCPVCAIGAKRTACGAARRLAAPSSCGGRRPATRGAGAGRTIMLPVNINIASATAVSGQRPK